MSREAGEHISRASFRQGKGPMSRTWPVLIAFSRENEVPGLPGTSLPVLPIAEESALGGGVARKLSLGQKAFCPFFFFHSFNKYLLKSCFMLSTVLGTGSHW